MPESKEDVGPDIQMRTEDPSAQLFEVATGRWIKVGYGDGSGSRVVYTTEGEALTNKESVLVPKSPGTYSRQVIPAGGPDGTVLHLKILVSDPLTSIIGDLDFSKLKARDLGVGDRTIMVRNS